MSGDTVGLIGIIFGACLALTGPLSLKPILVRVLIPIVLFLLSILITYLFFSEINYLGLLVVLYNIAFCSGYLLGLLLVYIFRFLLWRNHKKRLRNNI